MSNKLFPSSQIVGQEFLPLRSSRSIPASFFHFRVLALLASGHAAAKQTGSLPQRVARKTSLMPPTTFSFRAKRPTQTWPSIPSFLRPESLDRATHFRVVAVCYASMYGECPAAQKVRSHLSPPSQLSIPRPTER